MLGFLFVAFVSAADLSGLGPQGTFAPDVVAHWRDTLGWGMTLAVALTLVLSLVALLVLTTRMRRRRGRGPTSTVPYRALATSSVCAASDLQARARSRGTSLWGSSKIRRSRLMSKSVRNSGCIKPSGECPRRPRR